MEKAKRTLALAGGLLCASLNAAHAEGNAVTEPVDRLSFGLSQWDQNAIDPEFAFLDNADNGPYDKAADFRVDYRWGTSLIEATEPYVAFKPFVGLEATTRGSVFAGGGLLADVPIGPFIFTPSFAPGLLHEGRGKNMGSPLHFRTTLEFGYEFDNRMRITAHYSHLSNGGITDDNPGVNLIGAYLHIPVSAFGF